MDGIWLSGVVIYRLVSHVFSVPMPPLAKRPFLSLWRAPICIFWMQRESIIATLPETDQIITITQLVFTHDGNKLVYQLDSGRIALWDIPSGRVQAVLTEGMDPPVTIVISPDDKWIALGSLSQTKIWDIAQEQFVREMPRGGAFQFSVDGRRLLFEDDPYLVIYDTSTWNKISERILVPEESTISMPTRLTCPSWRCAIKGWRTILAQ